MISLKSTIFILAVLTIVSCTKSNQEVDNSNVPTNERSYFPSEEARSYIPGADTSTAPKNIKDNTYIADVNYFNTTTGANVTYVTKVKVENGMLKVIYWPNGVWLSSAYFKPQPIQNDGSCVISNIEAGYENRVQIFDLEFE
jgi:hypothetical protein